MDLDVHGVTLRFVDAGPAEEALVGRQLPDAVRAPGGGPADVTVRFVDRLSVATTATAVGADLVDDEGLIVTRPGAGRAGQAQARARVVLERDDADAIVCERHVREVPFLVSLLRIAALRKGLLPLHTVVLRHQGIGLAATGWSGSGKTAVLLAMVAGGASPVAAEWALVAPDGAELLGVPQPVRVKPSHVARWPALAPVVAGARTRRQRLLGAAAPVTRLLPGPLAAAAEGASHVDVPLSLLPGVATGGVDRSAPFDVLLLLEGAQVATPEVVPVDPGTAVERVAAGLEHDLDELRRARRTLRYARGAEVADPLSVDRAAHRQRELVERHLGSRPAMALRCRQPAPFDALRRAVESVRS